MLGRDEMLADRARPRGDGLHGAARYFDAQVAFAERLVLENLLARQGGGRRYLTYTSVDRFSSTAIARLPVVDTISGRR